MATGVMPSPVSATRATSKRRGTGPSQPPNSWSPTTDTGHSSKASWQRESSRSHDVSHLRQRGRRERLHGRSDAMSPVSRHEELKDAALKYWDEGWFVIPCSSGTKIPLVKWGAGAKRPTREHLERFWADESKSAPDIALKLDKKHVILDFDPKNEPKLLAPDAAAPAQELMRETRSSRTPSGGLHVWYRTDAPQRPVSYKGLDILTQGRMVLVPPSAGRSWNAESPAVAKQLSGDQVQAKVEWAIKTFGIDHTAGDGGLAREMLTSLEPIPVHLRNHTLAAIAGVLRSAGFRGNRLEAALAGLAEYVTEQPENDKLTMEDIGHIAQSIDWRNPRPFEGDAFTRYEYDTATPPPKLHWMIRDFLPAEGITSLFGLGKQGKSYIAMEILRCLALCEPFLGLAVPKQPMHVLYVDWEKRGSSLKRRLHAMTTGTPLHVTVLEPHKALPDMLDILTAEVALGGFDLVIIDSLTIALMQGDVKEAWVVIPALFGLGNIGVPVFALDHTPKPQVGQAIENMSAFGSVFKGNVASMNWKLMKLSGDPVGMNVVVKCVSNNFEVAPPDIHARIEFEKDDEGSLTKATVQRQEVEPAETDLWSYLSYQLAPTEDSEIARVLHLTLPATRQSLSVLEKSGRVRRVDETRWEISVAPAQEGDSISGLSDGSAG